MINGEFAFHHSIEVVQKSCSVEEERRSGMLLGFLSFEPKSEAQ
jgi:hypothetical protein